MKPVAGTDRIRLGQFNVPGIGPVGIDLGLWMWDARRLRSFVIPTSSPLTFRFEVGIGIVAGANMSKDASWISKGISDALAGTVPGASGVFRVSLNAATPGGWSACPRPAKKGDKQRVWLNWSATLSGEAGASLPGLFGGLGGQVTLTGKVPDWEAESDCVPGVGEEQALEEWLKDYQKFRGLLEKATARDGEVGFDLSGAERAMLLAGAPPIAAPQGADFDHALKTAADAPIESLQLPDETSLALRKAGIHTIADLADRLGHA